MPLVYLIIVFLVANFGQGFCYDDNPMSSHKQMCIQAILKNVYKKTDPYYSRALLTISCNDCDRLPKVPHAGEFMICGKDICQIMHNGILIVKNCYYGETGIWMTDIIYALKGHHEPQEEKVFYEVLKYIPPGGVMLELGSYWAYYSLWFAKKIPNSKNYLIEPSESNLMIGKKNFSLNNCVGNFYQHHIGQTNEPGSQNSTRVEIDAFLEKEHIDHLHILHSDIQGAELCMLNSCSNSIKSEKIDFFFISTHADSLHDQCLSFFKDHNFFIIAEHKPSESYSCDGLIVAKRKGVVGPEKVEISKLEKNAH